MDPMKQILNQAKNARFPLHQEKMYFHSLILGINSVIQGNKTMNT